MTLSDALKRGQITTDTSSFIMPIGTLVGINKPTIESIKMKTRKPKAHGHKGNAKSWQVHYRDNAVELLSKCLFNVRA